MRPTFIAIGPGRSGSTWMYHALSLHPEIGVSTTKETLYFELYYAKGEQWYARFFRHCAGKRAVGEVSNTYIFCPEAAERIHRFEPRMRLVSSLRNPVDRAFSHYLFLLRNAQVRGSFETAIERHPDLLTRGLYSRHLAPWLRRFPREQLLVLLFERLREDPYAFARRIYEFVGADPDFRSPALEERVYAAEKARSRVLARAAKWAAEAVRAAGQPQLVTAAKDSFVMKLLFRRYGKAEYPRMAPETRRRLDDYYRDEIDRVSDLTGEDVKTLWSGRA